MTLPGEGKEIIKIQLSDLDEIYQHKAELVKVLTGYLQEK
jgi:hypothetical protein